MQQRKQGKARASWQFPVFPNAEFFFISRKTEKELLLPRDFRSELDHLYGVISEHTSFKIKHGARIYSLITLNTRVAACIGRELRNKGNVSWSVGDRPSEIQEDMVIVLMLRIDHTHAATLPLGVLMIQQYLSFSCFWGLFFPTQIASNFTLSTFFF